MSEQTFWNEVAVGTPYRPALKAADQQKPSKDDQMTTVYKLGFAALALALTAAGRPAPSLSAYVGKYPSDKVAGVTLYHHPKFQRLVSVAAPNGSIRSAVLEGGVESLVHRQGALLVQEACEPHNCGDHEWVVAVLMPDGPAAICYHDSSLTGDLGRWFISGAPVGTTRGCSPEDGSRVPNEISVRLANMR